MADHSMDLPFEPVEESPLLDEHVHWSSGVVVMAAHVPVPDLGTMPALIFRFADAQGNLYPPFVLVQDDDQMAKLRPLLMESIHAAREAARAAS